MPIGTFSRKIHCHGAMSSRGIGSEKFRSTHAPYAGPMAMPTIRRRSLDAERERPRAPDEQVAGQRHRQRDERAAAEALDDPRDDEPGQPSSGPARRARPAPAEPMTNSSSATT